MTERGSSPSETYRMITFQNVSKRYGGVIALDDVTLDVRQGELLSICGENGAGKSTLMKILSGVVTQYDGEIRLRGKTVRFRGTRQAEQAGIGIIHQELNLVEQLSAAANVFLGCELRNAFGLLDQGRMNAETQSLLRQLECSIDPRVNAGTLRVGDQQLLEIAKALWRRTDILIMDEPTSALTETEVERLYRVIDRLRASGVTVIYISHKMDEVFRLSDRVAVLRDGRLVSMLDRDATHPREVAHLMVGREIESTRMNHPRQSTEKVLEVDQLSRAWPGHARQWRLQDVSLDLYRGEILGIAGLMGAGRTELLECLFGASQEPVTGQVYLNGEPVRFRSPAEALQAGVAVVTEDRKRFGLFPQMPVRHNITIANLHQAATAGIISRRHEIQMVEQMISQVGIKTASTEADINSLSGGNQQKAIIARGLLTTPKVLLLDDPTRGVDVGAKAELYQLMDQLCAAGIAIILTSSELPELLTVSDRILVLAEGRVAVEFSQGEATEQKIMEAVVTA